MRWFWCLWLLGGGVLWAQQQSDLLLPWVSRNAQFESLVFVNNPTDIPAELTLTGLRATGDGASTTVTINPRGSLKGFVRDLLPSMGEGSGMTIRVTSSTRDLTAGWVTNNLDAPSGRSPSQGLAVPVNLSPSDEIGQALMFGHLPATEGFTSAPVIVNISERPADVTLYFFNNNGDVLHVDRSSAVALEPFRPFAAVVSQLLPGAPEDVVLIAYSPNATLAGCGFVFNSDLEPALANARSVGFIPPDEPQQGKVYVTLFSHNEDSWTNVVGTRQAYTAYRENLLQRLQLIQSYGATLNWQSDHVVLEAMLAYEAGVDQSGSNGKNIVRYMVEDLAFSVDPHVHVSNFADVAALIEQLEVLPSNVLGGVRHVDCGGDYLGFLDLIDWRVEAGINATGTIVGRENPNAVWRPGILSVPAMGGHWFDDFSVGVWQPGAGADFAEHDPNSDIVYVGQGYPHDSTNLGPNQASGARIYAENGAFIKELVGKLQDGSLAADGFYTASLHIRDNRIVRDGGVEIDVNAGLNQVLTELAPLAAAGWIEYRTYGEVVALWRQEYGAKPFRLGFESFSMYQDVRDQAADFCAR